MNVLTLVLLAMLVFVAAVTGTTLLALRVLTRRFDAAVRTSVSAALAEDREREIADARTFWAEQEARAEEDAVLAGESVFTDGAGDNLVLLPAPRGYVDDEGAMDPEFADALRSALEELISETNGGAGGGHPVTHPAQPAPPAHPGHPAHPSVTGFVPRPTPTPEWTDLRLIELVDVGALLRDVRPGPMGTLDVYVFEDETTLCIAPGDREAGAQLIEAISGGAEVRLLGSSRLPGAHALTFALGAETDETVYILADRVVASL